MQIEKLCRDLDSKVPRLKYHSAKALLVLSAEKPDLLYPRFDVFVQLLDGDNRILRWNATRILGNLAAVDRLGLLDPVLDRLFAQITGNEMIGAANAIAAAAAIAVAKPHLAGRVADEILKVGAANYATPECRNVAIGHAIQAFDRFFPALEETARLLEFVNGQLDNPRPATRKKAARFLKKWAAAEEPLSPGERLPEAPACPHPDGGHRALRRTVPSHAAIAR